MHESQAAHPSDVKSMFIMGLPNTGKTSIFNDLTSTYSIVANYPLTTVTTETVTAVIRKTAYQVTDTPGLHGLYIYSEEELSVRNAVFTEQPDIIIQCIDTNRLKQSLFLTSDLMELEIPMVISLNYIEETAEKGQSIDSDELSILLGIPVVEYFTNQGRGLKKLSAALEHAAVPAGGPVLPGEIEKSITRIAGLLPETFPYRRKTATLLLQNDPWLLAEIRKQENQELQQSIHGELQGHHVNITRMINNARNRWVETLVSRIWNIREISTGKRSFLEKVSHYSRHPVYGFPILAVFLLISYLAVVHIANFFADGLDWLIVTPSVAYLESVIPAGFFQDLLIGNYGILTLGLFNAVATVLPVLSVFFFVFGLMEDIGYLPNLTVLVKRLLERIGLTGKSIMPLILGFGCKTMATLTTKSIPSRKEKLIAIFLIAFGIPCSAQLALNMAILGKAGIPAFVIAFSFLFLVEIGAGAILNRILKDDKKTAFIQELSPFRAPNVMALLKKTGYRLYWFLKESIPIFIIAAAVLFFLDYFGILTVMKRVVRPLIVIWLGLPLDMVDALILTMARHEAGAGLILRMSEAGKLNTVQNIIAVVITTMFVPCIANIIALFRELGARIGIVMTLAINISAFTMAGILHWILILFFQGVLV